MNISILFGKPVLMILAGALLLLIFPGAAPIPYVRTMVDKSVVITNVTDPSIPGRLSVVVGDGWNVTGPVLKLLKVENGAIQNPSNPSDITFVDSKSNILRIVKNGPQVITCDVPADKFSVYAVVARGKEGFSKPVIVNAAKAEWLSKAIAASSDTIRVFGRNLVNLDLYPEKKNFDVSAGYGSYLRNTPTKVYLETPGGTFLSCRIVKSSAYDVHFILPSSLADGQYNVYAHNGLGGKYGWSLPVELTIQKKKSWSTKLFNVRDFGARGEIVADTKENGGWNNDGIAIQQALDAAGANGGGIVYFPAGSYYVAQTLVIPKFTVLKGESRERSWIWFPDAKDHGSEVDYVTGAAITVGFRGLSDFTFENLSIHSVYTNILIAAPFIKDNANTYADLDLSQRADNVTIQNCNIVHEPYYQYHRRQGDPMLVKDQVFNEDERGMEATIAIHGDNTRIINSRIRGGGMAIVLASCRYSTIANNELIIGRAANAIASREFGYPELPCPQKIIIEDNLIWPATPTHHSGLWCHAVTRDMYVARNDLHLTWGSDAEGLLWHGWGPEKCYEVESAGENTITAKHVDKIEALGWQCIIVKGKGIGQKRIVKQINGNTLLLDRPWDIIPEDGCKMDLLFYHVHEGITIVLNKLADMGAGIYCWGESWNWIVDGNSLTRCGGVMLEKVAYTPDRAWSGNYFAQILHNKLDQGRYDNKINVNGTHSTRGYFGTGGYREHGNGTIANLGHIYRDNLLTNDCAIAFWDKVLDNWNKTPYGSYVYTGPLVDSGMVVEDNRFKDCKLGISIGDAVSGVERGNIFQNVTTKIQRTQKADLISDYSLK